MAKKILGKVVGADGATPYIGDNGNWFIGNRDTGEKANCEHDDENIRNNIKDNVDDYFTKNPVSEKVADYISNHQVVSNEQVDNAVHDYLAANPPTGGATNVQVEEVVNKYFDGDSFEDKINELLADTKDTVSTISKEVAMQTDLLLADTYEEITSNLTFSDGFLNVNEGNNSYTLNTDADFSYSTINVKKGEKYKVCGYSYYGQRLVAYINSDNQILSLLSEDYSIKYISPTELDITEDGILYVGYRKDKSGSFHIYKPVKTVNKEYIEQAISEIAEDGIRDELVEFDRVVENAYIMPTTLVEIEHNGARYGVIDNLKSGKKYKIGATTGVNVRSYIVVDNNNNNKIILLADAESWDTVHDYDVELEITEIMNNCTLYVCSISSTYFGLKEVKQVKEIDGDKIKDYSVPLSKFTVVPSPNPLYMKTAIFDGDSICNGGSVGTDSPYYKWGWAMRIARNNNMTFKNYGIGGGTITSGTTNSDGSNRHWESTNIATMASEYPNADYVILESCLNDGFINLPIGDLSDTYDDDFDHTTFSGAVEYMLQQAITLFPNAKIGVIIPHRVKSNLNNWHEFVRKACKKWSVPYIDLYYESGICVDNTTQNAVVFSDGSTHLSDAGYDMISSKIEAWMKTL